VRVCLCVCVCACTCVAVSAGVCLRVCISLRIQSWSPPSWHTCHASWTGCAFAVRQQLAWRQAIANPEHVQVKQCCPESLGARFFLVLYEHNISLELVFVPSGASLSSRVTVLYQLLVRTGASLVGLPAMVARAY
jgi:hypothetical protein